MLIVWELAPRSRSIHHPGDTVTHSPQLTPPVSPDALIDVDALLDDEERQIRESVRALVRHALPPISPPGTTTASCPCGSWPSNSAISDCSECTWRDTAARAPPPSRTGWPASSWRQAIPGSGHW